MPNAAKRSQGQLRSPERRTPRPPSACRCGRSACSRVRTVVGANILRIETRIGDADQADRVVGCGGRAMAATPPQRRRRDVAGNHILGAVAEEPSRLAVLVPLEGAAVEDVDGRVGSVRAMPASARAAELQTSLFQTRCRQTGLSGETASRSCRLGGALPPGGSRPSRVRRSTRLAVWWPPARRPLDDLGNGARIEELTSRSMSPVDCM